MIENTKKNIFINLFSKYRNFVAITTLSLCSYISYDGVKFIKTVDDFYEFKFNYYNALINYADFNNDGQISHKEKATFNKKIFENQNIFYLNKELFCSKTEKPLDFKELNNRLREYVNSLD